MTTAISIERLLAWTYRDELPKRDLLEAQWAGGWGTIAALGTRVSGGPQIYAELVSGGVHPDAFLVEAAVLALKPLTLHMEEPAQLLADMPPNVRREAAAKFKGWRVQLDVLVARMAMTGQRPDWLVEPPVEKFVMAPNGRPAWFVKREKRHIGAFDQVKVEIVEENGFDPRAKRRQEGSYRKTYFDPDPGWAVDARADHLAWRLALDRIAESLAGKLARWRVSPMADGPLPWLPGVGVRGCLIERQATETPRQSGLRGRR
jgi:hypothetical protein